LTSCTAITQGGGRCKGIAIDGSGLCHAHHPDRADARRRSASKGGKRGGRGRSCADYADLKRDVKVVEGVLSGEVPQCLGPSLCRATTRF
jgi:hypothetical protein